MSPVRIELAHELPVSVSAGFAYITDPANWPHYWPDLVEVEHGSRWRAPGDRARLRMRLFGVPFTLDMTLSRYEADRVIEYTSRQRGLPHARHERHFAAAPRGCVYRVVVELTPRRGIRGAFDRHVARRAVERAVRRTMANLEARTGATCGDGTPS